MPDARSAVGPTISAPHSLQESLRQREATRYLTLASHLLPSADDAPLVLPTVSVPIRAATLLSWRQRDDQFCAGCGSSSMIMSAARRTRESMLSTSASRTTLVGACNGCGQWTRQAPDHYITANGVAGEWTVPSAPHEFVQLLTLFKLHAKVVPLNAPGSRQVCARASGAIY